MCLQLEIIYRSVPDASVCYVLNRTVHSYMMGKPSCHHSDCIVLEEESLCSQFFNCGHCVAFVGCSTKSRKHCGHLREVCRTVVTVVLHLACET